MIQAKELLFLVHRIPYPPNKGDKIRSFNILKHLAKTYRVHVGAFVDNPDDWRYQAELEALVNQPQGLVNRGVADHSLLCQSIHAGLGRCAANEEPH